MSMGNIESYHQLVDEKSVKKAVGKKILDSFLEKLAALISEYGDSEVHDVMNEGDFMGNICDDDESYVAVKEAYDALRDEFKKKTGMRVLYCYFEGDGDCYDDIVPGTWHWELLGSEVFVPRKLTKKAEKFIKEYGDISIDQRFSVYG